MLECAKISGSWTINVLVLISALIFTQIMLEWNAELARLKLLSLSFTDECRFF
jgi:hypothetical protein